MKFKSLLFFAALLLVVAAFIQACEPHYFRSNYAQANKLLYQTKNLREKPFLKVHLKSGDACILENPWQIDTVQNLVTGTGTRYDYNRFSVFTGKLEIPFETVALYETNTLLKNPESGRVTALGILTGANIAANIFCITNPKACYGSCPTFYLNENDNFHYADAEGFSNAILPSMEYADIDALNNPPLAGNSFNLTMKNEALETHCINTVKLLAYPRKKGERIYQSGANEFYRCQRHYELSQATGQEGTITGLLRTEDRRERFSLSDPENLSSKEEIYLTFDNVTNPQDLGLLINFRQTLMTTYLFYSAMGYMGDRVSDLFARLENDDKLRDKFDATTKELGKITVYRWNENSKKWEIQSQVFETGPIAFNRQILPLQDMASGSTVRLKLVLNKGLWRIDRLALTNIAEKVKLLEISPDKILNKGKPDPAALANILKPTNYLISMPGNEYKFQFTLPATEPDYELFLYSKGYYLEWMRDHWLQDKDLLKLREMVYNPKLYLKAEAANYKRYESTMEKQFWDSRIDTKTFSLYENKK